jgi:hypothetical protein
VVAHNLVLFARLKLAEPSQLALRRRQPAKSD